MKVMVISGGTIEDDFARKLLKKIKPDKIIAADKGLEFCDRNRICPNYITGDFDSTHRSLAERYEGDFHVPVDFFQPEKDMTDTDIALEKAISIGAGEVWFLGATGSRTDHTLSNIFDLYKLYRKGIRGYIADFHNLISMPPEKEIHIRKEEQFGTYISCFPFGGEVQGVTLEGFRYPLKDKTLVPGDGGLTVSNEITAQEAVIRYREGILILIQSRD